ncbi:MAG: membrane protein insertion efficiency factor YidD [Armatimonadota bacterium]|nr:membrane protein insertion efficiency factor YidD [Armatimonadota bacterium]
MVLLLVSLVRLYQKTAPFRPAVCRFYPSCSRYTIDALQKHGAIRGLWMALKRISKCHPFNEGGYDPVL